MSVTLFTDRKVNYVQGIQAIDLFCGVGGLTCGLGMSGLEVVAGVDIDASCAFSYESNNASQFICSDIGAIDSKALNGLYTDNIKYRVLVGCAPCQPFSTHSNKQKNKKDDARWNLVGTFFSHVDSIRPDVISMENVPGLAKQEVFSEFISNLESIGYFVHYEIVFCPDYGIAQTRKRLVLLASKLGDIKLIEPTHDRKNPGTIKSVIGHLPRLNHGKQSREDPLHTASKLSELNYQRMLASKPGGSWRDWDDDLLLECHKKDSGASFGSVYGRLSWEKPSSTITTQFYRFGTGRFGHPKQNRALSLREGALIQTFPEGYQFAPKGEKINLTRVGRHIGNAVPPKLGEVVGLSIQAHLKLLG